MADATHDLMEMDVGVPEAAVMGMLMSMKGMDVSIALLDATEFPYSR